jgi:drug/metabolite transporter (DMT)-like permease
MSLFWAFLSALLYGSADFAGGYACRRNSILSVLAVSQIAGLVLAFFAALALGQGLPDPRALGYGAAGGLSGVLGLFMLYRGIAKTLVAVVSPASALVGALIPMLFGAAMGERPSGLALAGSLLCVPAVLLLSWEKGEHANPALARSALFHGILAGLGFGGFFIAVSRTGSDSGLWPLIGSRSTSILIILCAVLLRRKKVQVEKGSMNIVLAAGILDMGANIAFLLASRTGLLMLASALTSLFPAPTVILARIFMKERLRLPRILGLALAITGMALIAM